MDSPPRKVMRAELRTLSDRRRKPTPFLSRYWMRGRRRAGRRDGETHDIYVDRYTRREWMLAIGILVLSMADLGLTLNYLSAGGEEANPIMRWALEHGTGTFATLKTSVTAIGVLILLIHSKFRRVSWWLEGVFLLYCLLITYHMWLRIRLPL